MSKTIYTEEELLNYEDHGVLPEGVDLAPFTEMVAQVQETMREFEDKLSKRKGVGFFHHVNRPRRKRQPKEVVDNDGWTSMTPKKHVQGGAPGAVSGTGEREAEEEEEFEQVKSFKTNAAKISSGKTGSADSKDTVAIAHVSRFNAFDALNADDDEE
ncbi:DEKNAAC101209 [Brettanomyces naardenensis]|uniref:Cap-associated protein CAF20 n=1 Tax=Brettanomyces naardenensis TaxID=13370 RepID=A0A448YHB9_BRENA|nr:DEKNAAC101209 [Brettanomyces naardenensis]